MALERNQGIGGHMISETEILARFEKHRPAGPDRWMVTCPAHADVDPSLQITRAEDRWLVKCFAGCPTEEVIAAAGLEWKDLFAEDRPSEITEVYPYEDESGKLLFEVCRKSPKDFFQRRPTESGGWVSKLGDTRRVPYKLPKIRAAAAAGGTVFVVEGERDVHAIEQMGGTATTNPGGAGKWRPEYAETFKGAAQVVVVPDDDPPGHDHARDIVASLNGIPVQVVLAAEGKDPADHLAAGYGLDDFREMGLAAADVPELAVSIVTLDEFAGVEEPGADPILGASGDAVIPEGGDVMIYGDGGASKTTLGIDLAFHLAAGDDWLGIEVPRPVRVLLIEAEGPRPLFRQKLRDKRDAWKGFAG